MEGWAIFSAADPMVIIHYQLVIGYRQGLHSTVDFLGIITVDFSFNSNITKVAS
jgi:hypothetical protein